jgi:predicted Zn-dependent protease
MLMNLMALDYNYAGIDAMIAETKKNKLYNDTVQLEYAGYMIIQSKFDEAEGLLTELVRTLKFIKQDIMHQQTRVMLSFVYVSLNKKDKVEALFESVKNDSTIPTPEKEYYTAIINMLSDSAGSFAQLKAAQEKMPFYPVVNLLYARANIMKGDYKGAIAIYEKLPEVIGRSPRILVEFARALTKNDQYDEALGLLNIVHQRKLYTRNSLELFRDITFKKQLYEKSLEAQKVLETIFKDDTRLQYSSALLALKTGNKEKALKIITELKQKYPQEKQFEMTMFSMLLLKGEYQKVIDECKNSKIDQYLLTSYLAQAYLGLGDSVRAGQIYEKSIAYKKSLGLMIEYAQILSNGGSYSKSASIYKRILNDYKETVEKDTTRTHLFFNNYAWVLMHGTDTEKKEGLFYSRKAYNLKPGNIGILDTYGRCLIENGKYKDCIKLLKENKMIVKEPQLLYYLATAYEKTEDINNALRTYKDILACADSSKVLALEVSKNFLQTQIKRLSDAE